MMGDLRQYILSVILTALICGIFAALAPNSSKGWLKLLCGMIMTISIMQPFTKVHTLDFDLKDESLQKEGAHWAAEGEKIAQNAMADIITQNAQAYIMDKAKDLGILVDVEITVNNDTIPVPVYAELRGDVSPYARLQVTSIIMDELGIPKENIRWMQ